MRWWWDPPAKTRTDLERYFDPPAGERPRSQSTPQPPGPAAPQGAEWLHDEQIRWLREARSLLGSVQYDLGQVRSMRERPLGDGPQLQMLEKVLRLADRELELLTAARHAELR